MFHKVFFLLLTFLYLSYGFEASIEKKVKASGAVSDIVYSHGKIFVSTERSKVDIVDLKTGKIVKEIDFPYFEDFMGELQPAKVFSADVSPDGKTLIAVVQTERGGKDVYLVNLEEKGKPEKVLSRKAHLPISRVRFVSNNRVIFGLSGDEVVLYDLKEKKQIYRIPVGMSFFSDMALDTDKKLLAVADESGDIHVVDVEKGKLIKNIEEMNKDKSFSVDIKNKTVISGGRDKKASVYSLKTGKRKEFLADDFMVFSVGLSPSGKTGAYLYNDKYDVAIIDTGLGEKLGFLKGHKSTPGKILFINENTIVIGCDNGEIYIWRIKR